MHKSMRPVVKIEDGEGGAQPGEWQRLQEAAGAGGAAQRRRVGEAGDAAWDEVLRVNAEAQAQAIRGMEQAQVLEARVAELAAEVKIKTEALESRMQSKDALQQAKDDLLQDIQAKDVIIQTKDSEIRQLHEDNARLSAECAAAGFAPRPADAQAETHFQCGQLLYGEQRFREAAEHWMAAALQLHGPSHAHLSDMLMYGRSGLNENEERAFQFASYGAALGCAHSKGALGYCYLNGFGVAPDQAKGLALGRDSAAAGSCFGQHVVGVCYHHAYGGVAQDYTEASRLYSLAVVQGHAMAQNNLGSMFAQRHGVALDKAEAVRLFRLAAAQGLSVAQANLGYMFEHGQGVRKNRAEAIRWYRLAAMWSADATAALRRLGV